ncbi:hypothetical protein IWQ62_002681 [Dispira parvispora]|uniref:Chitin-binding type-2 domain-containing protein n=1 Tax=Dispira parvispora TaxID=1520584 RepID=A0A9W8APG8_9FUNG|nr:hypothetical protein IWQ62_002681 [Dispira parvispora]
MNYLSTLSLLVVAMLATTMSVQASPRPNSDSSKGIDSKASADAQAALGSANEPWYTTYFSKCVDGTMRCDRYNRNYFYVCDHKNPVKFQCAPGTVCYPNGEYIICNYP